jgi:hypothetical protein
MLLDPLEEQLNLPARPVERADGHRRQGKLVAQDTNVLALSASRSRMRRI